MLNKSLYFNWLIQPLTQAPTREDNSHATSVRRCAKIWCSNQHMIAHGLVKSPCVYSSCTIKHIKNQSVVWGGCRRASNTNSLACLILTISVTHNNIEVSYSARIYQQGTHQGAEIQTLRMIGLLK